MYPTSFEDVGEEKFSHSGHINGFGAGNDNHPLHKEVVDHNQNGVHSMHVWEVCDKVHSELFKGKRR